MVVRHFTGVRNKLYMFIINKILTRWTEKNFRIKRNLLRKMGHEVGDNTRIVSPVRITSTVCRISIGRDCFVGTNFTVHGNGCVRIGDQCDIAPDVTFLTGGHAIGASERRAGEGEKYQITVGNGVWIGARSTLFNNIHVDDSSIVAACSCVNKSVPKNQLFGGVPAKFIKYLNE